MKTRNFLKSVVFLGLLAAVLAVPCGCSLSDTGNPGNPSYRMLTTQVQTIESALGTRGGLAVLTRPSAPVNVQSSGMSMSASTSQRPPSAAKSELNWNRINAQTKIIENAWQSIKLELERRKIESGPDWYLKFYRTMAVTESFEMALAAVKLDISTKRQERIPNSVSMLADSLAEIKKELNIFVIDWQRLAVSVGSLLVAIVILTALASLISSRLDRKLAKVSLRKNHHT